MKIYYMALKTMLQYTHLNFPFIDFEKKNTNDVIALLEYKDDIELMYPDGYKIGYYSILVGFVIDYEEQVLITGIKTNM